jgi:MinD-like ATPase involved in chromosome partitioning or flagellar assembly
MSDPSSQAQPAAQWDVDLVNRVRSPSAGGIDRPGNEPSASSSRTTQTAGRQESARAAQQRASPLDSLTSSRARRPAAYEAVSARPGQGWLGRSARRLASLVRSDDAPDWLIESAAAIQAPVTTGRRIAVIGACGGAGTTTIAVLLARTLSALRADQIAITTFADDRGVLDARLGELGPVNLDAGLLGDPVTSWEQLSRTHAYSVCDAGREADHPVVDLAHVVVVSTSTSVSGVAGARQAIHDLERAGQPLDSIVVTPVAAGRDTGMSTPLAAALLKNSGVRVVSLPEDRHLAGGGSVSTPLLAEPTQVAMHRLAAEVSHKAVARR